MQNIRILLTFDNFVSSCTWKKMEKNFTFFPTSLHYGLTFGRNFFGKVIPEQIRSPFLREKPKKGLIAGFSGLQILSRRYLGSIQVHIFGIK